MKRFEATGRLKVLVGCVFITTSVIAALCWQSPVVTWNSGNREKLRYSITLAAGDLASGRADANCFLPHPTDVTRDSQVDDAKMLLNRYGATVQWRTRESQMRESITFYPLALSEYVGPIGEYASGIPLLVMIPLAEKDTQTVPTLFGCSESDIQTALIRQRSRMLVLLRNRDLGHVLCLLADGEPQWLDSSFVEHYLTTDIAKGE